MIWSILLTPSPNPSAPSAPTVIPVGVVFAVGIGYSLMAPAVVIRATFAPSVNHNAPSGPAVMSLGKAFAVGFGYSVIVGGGCANAREEYSINAALSFKITRISPDYTLMV